MLRTFKTKLSFGQVFLISVVLLFPKNSFAADSLEKLIEKRIDFLITTCWITFAFYGLVFILIIIFNISLCRRLKRIESIILKKPSF